MLLFVISLFVTYPINDFNFRFRILYISFNHAKKTIPIY